MANILIVDDDYDFCSSLQRVFERLGHESRFALSLRDGLQETSQITYDFVFLDVALPDGNGLKEINAFKTSSTPPEIIILTGQGDPDAAGTAIRDGAWDYIEKPVSMGTLKTLLDRAISHRKTKSEAPDRKPIKIEGIIGQSDRINACLDVMTKAAHSRSNVIISGETGTGKELFAQAIHANSPHTKGELIVIDCTNLPKNLAESILFGHTKGSFTGAYETKEGLFKQADGGTVFLDEVGELTLPLQKSLLRVLQERKFRPVGAKKEVLSNFRVIAATNRDLSKMVDSKLFRKDLYYRLNGLRIDLPALRERKEDIPVLTNHYVNKLCSDYLIEPKTVSQDFLNALASYPWPGNVRELVNALYASVDTAFDVPVLFPHHLPLDIRATIAKTSFVQKKNPDALGQPEVDSAAEAGPMDESLDLPQLKEVREKTVSAMEAQYLIKLTRACKGKVKLACNISGLSRARLYELLKKHKTNLKAN